MKLREQKTLRLILNIAVRLETHHAGRTRVRTPLSNTEPHLNLVVLEVHVVLVSVLVGEGHQGNDLRPHQSSLGQHLGHHLAAEV